MIIMIFNIIFEGIFYNDIINEYFLYFFKNILKMIFKFKKIEVFCFLLK